MDARKLTEDIERHNAARMSDEDLAQAEVIARHCYEVAECDGCPAMHDYPDEKQKCEPPDWGQLVFFLKAERQALRSLTEKKERLEEALVDVASVISGDHSLLAVNRAIAIIRAALSQQNDGQGGGE